MLLPSLLLVDKASPGLAQIVPAHSNPRIVAGELIDTLPCGISTSAAGRLVPPNLRFCVAVLQLLELSPLLATITRFSALGLLLQGRGALVLAAKSAWQSLPVVRLMLSCGRKSRRMTGLGPWLVAVSIERVAPLRN